MSERRAIVTLAIGDDFAERWHQVCEPNWRAYADRHGYELVCITEPVDDSQRARDRSPSWQKLLLLGQPFAQDLDRLVWVDSDVVFGHDAPDIAAGVPAEKVGAVDELNVPVESIKDLIHPVPRKSYYGAFGFSDWFDEVVQAGIMVTSPRHHRKVFEHVYEAYEDIPGLYYEMRPLSYELLDRDLVHWLDRRFNFLWTVWNAWRHPHLLPHLRHPLQKDSAAEALSEVYCFHFAGRADVMEWALTPRAEPPPRRRIPRARTPVVLFLDSPPEAGAKVLDAVRQARPERLLVVGDDRKLVDEVDWDCELVTNFTDDRTTRNERVASGLGQAFENYDRAIILEDDCVPDPSFFRWCDEMLDRYGDEPLIRSIAGTNFQFDETVRPESYHYSRYPMTWGWATWRHAWESHDPEMSAWPELRDSGWLKGQLRDPNTVAFWSFIFERTYRNGDAWEYAWLLSSWRAGALHAIPNFNLVSKVGLGEDAARTIPRVGMEFADVPLEEMEFPLRGPAEIAPDDVADANTNRFMFGGIVSDMFGRVRHHAAIQASERA